MKGECAKHGETEYLPPDRKGDSYCVKCVLDFASSAPALEPRKVYTAGNFSMGCQVRVPACSACGEQGTKPEDTPATRVLSDVRFWDISLVPPSKCDVCGQEMEPASSHQWRCTNETCVKGGLPVHTGVYPIQPQKTYRLLEEGGHLAIKCLRCGLVSHNQGDVDHLYCGHCHEFHAGPT